MITYLLAQQKNVCSVQINTDMSRYFCMIDTKDTLPNRLTVNVQTRNNVAQALAENLYPKLTHEQRVEQALKPSSDYMDRVWVRDHRSGCELEVHVESSVLVFNNKHIKNNSDWERKKDWEHVDEYRNWGGDQSQVYNDWFKCGEFFCLQKRHHILNPPGPDHLKTNHINTHVRLTNTMLPGGMFIKTCSKRCDVGLCVPYDKSVWNGWLGAQIKQSDDNKRDHLKHVI